MAIIGLDNGSGYPVLYGDYNRTTIGILADEVRIENMGVTGPPGQHSGITVTGNRSTIKNCIVFGNKEGIMLTGSNGNTILMNEICGNFVGLELNQSDLNAIVDNTVHDNSFHGIKLNGSSNNTLIENAACYNSDDAITIENASHHNLISENNVSCNALDSIEFENKNAIYVYGSYGNIISGNLMKLNGGTVARDHGARIYRLGDAVQLKGTTDTVVSDNVMIDNHYAVWIDNSENVTVRGNTASGGYYNILIENSRDCLVSDNELTKSGRNLRLLKAHNCTLRDNIISDSMYDITLTDSWFNTIENCTWGNSAPGYQSLWLSNSSYNVLTRNTAHNNSAGIWLENSANNLLYLNDFLDGVYFASPGNYWNTSRPEIYLYMDKPYTGYLGNRYGDYTGSDTDGDGVGEVSYTLNGVTDPYPITGDSKSYVIPDSTPVNSPSPGSTPVIDGTTVSGEPDFWQRLGMYFKTWLQ